MPRLCANLTTLFTDVPFLDRFERASRAGFNAIEFQSADDADTAQIKARLSGNGLTPVLFNMAVGDWEAGERGLAALPGRREAFRASVAQALDRAADLGCTRLHMLAGIVPPDGNEAAMRDTYLDNLRYAAQFAATAGIAVLIEPISRESIPGYFLTGLDMAADLIDEAGEDNVFIQYDLFHRRFVGPDLVSPFFKHADRIRHVQIAGWPGRHEPDDGVLEWESAFEALDRSGYDGFVGCEYFPNAGTEAGLGWARRFLRGGE